MTAASPRMVPPAPPDLATTRAPLPYGRQLVEEDDIAAVVAALRSEHLAQGPRVAMFEAQFAEAVGASHAVACSSGTAALHLALCALDVSEHGLCIVPSISFLSTATAVRFCGAEVLFADVDPDTGLMTPETLSAALDLAPHEPAAVLPVHLAGRLCDTAQISRLARRAGAAVIEDACHAVGGRDQGGHPVGACPHSEAAVFSFHPVKTLATGEGGMVTLNAPLRAERMSRLRNHGVTRDPALLSQELSFDRSGRPNPWSYEQLELGFNYRMNEMEAALGLSQLAKLERFVVRRAALAGRYRAALAALEPSVRPTPYSSDISPGLHLFTVLIDFEALRIDRAALMRELAHKGVATQVHYIPLHRQPYFRSRYGDAPLPGADAYFSRVLALPLFPAMSDADVDRVVEALSLAIEQTPRLRPVGASLANRSIP